MCKRIPIFLILFGLFVACSSKQSKISKADENITSAEKNYETVKETDWKELDEQVTAIEKDLQENRDKYTPEQREKANKLIGRYSALQIKRGLKDFTNTLEDAGQQLKGAIEALTDSIKK